MPQVWRWMIQIAVLQSLCRRLRKIAESDYSFVMCLSIRMEQLRTHWTDFHEIWHFSIFRKSVEKIQVSLKPNENNVYFTPRPIHIFDHISLSSSYDEKCFNKYCTDNQNTHFICNNFLFENRGFLDMWKNTVQTGRPQTTIWRMRVACWKPKATNAHSEYVILVAFLLQQWLHERASMLHYAYTACLVKTADE